MNVGMISSRKFWADVQHCYSAGLGSPLPIEQLYPPLFTLGGARQEPGSPFEKWWSRNTWKVAYWSFEVNLEYRLPPPRCRPEDGKNRIFISSCRPQLSRRWKVLLNTDFIAVVSQTLNHKICFWHAIRWQYVSS